MTDLVYALINSQDADNHILFVLLFFMHSKDIDVN